MGKQSQNWESPFQNLDARAGLAQGVASKWPRVCGQGP